MVNIVDWLQSLPAPGLVAGAGVIALAESTVGVGFFMPGQAAMMIASASVGSVPGFLALWAVVTVGALVGNVIGFELGRRVGPAVRETKLIRKYAAGAWDKAVALLERHGRRAVFIGRLTPTGLVNSVVPVVAGAARMSYGTFLPPLVAGAVCSTGLILLVGAGIAASLKNVSDIVLIVGGSVLVLVATIVIIKRRKEKSAVGAVPAQP
ncbi:DedA family protein [Lentzea kentuckyensis]|uniref:DedA family protein n=1 Tax=Lentzea kentuckyensis TaxID=360086 RepID=UPI000A3A6857|nr:DedA family protein [Lentzea kentuckyensis]